MSQLAQPSSKRAARRRGAPGETAASVPPPDERTRSVLDAVCADAGLTEPRFFAKGQRGVVYVAARAAGGGGAVAIKVERTDWAARIDQRRMMKRSADAGEAVAAREARWLRRCNALGIGPALVAERPGAVATE